MSDKVLRTLKNPYVLSIVLVNITAQILKEDQRMYLIVTTTINLDSNIDNIELDAQFNKLELKN